MAIQILYRRGLKTMAIRASIATSNDNPCQCRTTYGNPHCQ